MSTLANAHTLSVHGLYCGDGIEVRRDQIGWEDVACVPVSGDIGGEIVVSCTRVDDPLPPFRDKVALTWNRGTLVYKDSYETEVLHKCG
jgi:hypothetical protein